MKRSLKKKYTYHNLLLNQLIVSAVNQIWLIYESKFRFKDFNKHLSILFVIDLGSREIIKILATQDNFNYKHITRAINNLLIIKNIKDEIYKT